MSYPHEPEEHRIWWIGMENVIATMCLTMVACVVTVCVTMLAIAIVQA